MVGLWLAAFAPTIGEAKNRASPADNQPAPISAVQLRADPLGLTPEDGAQIRARWAVAVSAPDRDITGFVDYAYPFSRLRLSDGRAVAVAFSQQTDAVKTLVASQVYGVDEESEDAAVIYRQPEHPPAIADHRFLDGFEVGGRAGAQQFIGLWADADGQQILAAFDDDAHTARRPTVIARLSGTAQVVSGIHPHHGGPTTISLATAPDASGRFEIAVYEWRR